MSSPNKSIVRYGMNWPPLMNPVAIEMDCIRRGGTWVKRTGGTGGAGLYHHYLEMMRLLWPDMSQHRWLKLMVKEYLESTLLSVIGPANSGKTQTMAMLALVDYICFPLETLCIVSSTNVRGLELRVYGAIKSLHAEAKRRYPDFIPGHFIDSKHALCTDNIEEGDVRDMRRGIICFPAGTLVDTPDGPRSIETLEPGERVINAIGTGTITQTQCSHSPKLVRVHLSNRKHIDCTEDHPFLTPRGWVKAVALETYERVFSANETVRLVQEANRSRIPKSKILLGSMPNKIAPRQVLPMREDIPPVQAASLKTRNVGTILQSDLCESMGSGARSSSKAGNKRVSSLWDNNEEIPSQSRLLLNSMSGQSTNGSMQRMREAVYLIPNISKQSEDDFLWEVLQAEIDMPESWWEALGANDSGNASAQNISNRQAPLRGIYGPSFWEEPQAQIRSGFGLSENQTRCGTGRKLASDSIPEIQGRETRQGAKVIRVDSVEILEPGSDARFEQSSGGYPVYNLSVDGHPSYSVEGVIVHNCIPCLGSQGQWTGGLSNFVGIKQKRRRLFSDEASFMKQPFLDALANLNTGDFKGMFIGNPLGDGDPLDKLAEPKDGWGSHPEPKTTTTWNTRDLGGRCINLIGTDSPNFDYPKDEPPRYPYLIHQDHFDRVIARWGERDWHYYQQCLGVRITGIEAKKVITRDLCYQWHALEQVFWLNENRKKVYAVDAAYGSIGGDRCVGGWVEWGKDVTGMIRMRINNPVIIPVKPAKMAGIEPEYQIARFVREECERESIPPSSVFYDATGRGSLGTAFAREWSADVNPIEFGGAPSERPVTSEMTIQDPKTREMRLMTAKERFSKFVTELWWSVRYVIEADQMRELPNEVMDEGTRRLWRMTKGNKIEIETKDEMKERIGYSPDLFDWVATAIEGARRMGFQIASMTSGTPPKRQEMMDDLLRKSRERAKSYTLNYR